MASSGNNHPNRLRPLHILAFVAAIAALWPLEVNAAAFDYCDVPQCLKKKHIACHNHGEMSENCPEETELVKMHDYIPKILSWYNRFRNKVATGLKYIKTAARMGAMAWDEELANLAEMNVKRCELGLDGCRATEEFAYSGQNTGYFEYQNGYFMDDQLLQQRTQSWISGIRNVNNSILKKFPRRSHPSVGRATIIINERNNRIGCAAVSMKMNNETTRFLLTCNYATTNLIGEPVYTFGKPGSLCTKRDKEYKNLCSIDEDYKNNEL